VTMENPYKTYCSQAVESETEFNRFKRNRVYCDVVQTVSYWEGRLYLHEIENDYPHLTQYFELFRKLDSVGDPELFPYRKYGDFAPTTLRYIKVLGDLSKLFGSLDGLDVVEIGCGYGGQCALLKMMFNIRSYTLVDLEPVVQLTRKCMERLGLTENVRFMTMDQLSENDRYDLFISNYAFTELPPSIQDVYWDRTVRGTSRGYLTFNANPVSHPKSKLIGRLENPKVFEERPRTADDNCIIAWGTDASIPGERAEKILPRDSDKGRCLMLQHFGFLPLEDKKVARREEVKIYAAKGNSQAMFDLGLMNYFEQFEGGNAVTACEWFRRSSERGNINALKFLGMMYFTGDGVPCDRTKTVDCFRKAATAGDSSTQILLGRMLLTGEGVDRDESEAIHWLNQAEPKMDKGVRNKMKQVLATAHAN
jgi:hypothetical protein